MCECMSCLDIAAPCHGQWLPQISGKRSYQLLWSTRHLPCGLRSGMLCSFFLAGSLGMMPNSTQLASVPTIPPLLIGPTPGRSRSTAAWSSAMVGSQQTKVPTAPMAGSLVLTLSAHPFPARLVERIRSGQFVKMRDLLTDSISLLQHLDQMQPGPPSS